MDADDYVDAKLAYQNMRTRFDDELSRVMIAKCELETAITVDG